MTHQTTSSNGRNRRVGATLFLSLFAAQAGAIAISPLLADVARDLDVSTAAAGQLRTVTGLVAGVTALSLRVVGSRFGLGRQLLGGGVLLAVGSLGSAAAPSLYVLAAAQVPVGAGIAVLTTAGTLAAAEWVPPEGRAQALSWALVGQPAAWIVGMPLIGIVGASSWRYAWLALPLSAAVLASLAVAGRRDPRPHTMPPAPLRVALAAPGLARWLVSEQLANTAWAGTLVYSGALIAQSYGTTTELTGVVLALGGAAYVAGNITLRRLASHETGRPLVPLVLALAVTTALFGVLRPSILVSTALFSAAAFAAGGRTLVSSAFGLAVPAALRPGAMAMRAASMQFGYFTGSLAAGSALALGGYQALGSVLGVLFLLAAVVLRPRGVGNAFFRVRRLRASVTRGAWSSTFSARSKSLTAPRRCASPRASSAPCWPSSS
jgi:predicted MFS family arabinose efflux permease